MDSSSEGSFAWTDASDNSTDNGTMTKSNQSKNQSGEESESGKNYKKKLQHRLFLGSEDGETASGPAEDLRPRKRKLSRQHSDAHNKQSPKKQRVKAEPESDAEIPKKKKIKSSELVSQGLSNDLYDESFLDSKVKAEQKFAVPSPVKVSKKKKKSMSGANDTTLSNGDVTAPDGQTLPDSQEVSNSRLTFEDSSTPGSSHAEEENKADSIKQKKKKKKSSKKTIRSEVSVPSSADEGDGADNSSVTEKLISASTDELSDSPAGTQNHDDLGTNDKMISFQENKSTSADAQTHASLRINSQNLMSKRKTRMSERIQFEDEDDSDVQMKNNSSKTCIKSTLNGKKVSSFIEKSSISLRPLRAQLPNALLLTDDDDVWLVRCPKEVKPEAFQDKKWILDSKCKIKLDGQTYEGEVGDTNSNITILSSDQDRALIKNITLNGCIRLRRRLPKAHFQEDNVMVNKQTNFIPLPDTKCRHPLFGLHYKKAVKLPSGVAERLSAARGPAPRASPGAKRKKKRDREKAREEERGSPAAFKMEHTGRRADAPEELTQSMIAAKKKKKKRKQSDPVQDDSATSAKRAKRNLESAEAWESEKAIEENLFNF